MVASFFAGVVSTLAVLLWALSNRRRATWAARTLQRAAGPSKRTFRVKRDWQPGDDFQDFKKLSKKKQLTHQYHAWRKFADAHQVKRPVSAAADSFVDSLG